jgi:hypothetical protein
LLRPGRGRRDTLRENMNVTSSFAVKRPYFGRAGARLGRDSVTVG